MEKEKRNIIRTYLIIIIIAVFTVITLEVMSYYNLTPKEYYKASDFKIKTIYSDTDYNNNNIDDYSDFVLGARKDANNKPRYISKYYETSYPPDNEGVCTDVIWRAFKRAGYSLRDMIDEDIKKYPNDYKYVKERDKNIDFRRVTNQVTFFSKYATPLTTNPKNIASWQPGDIVVFEDKHIGIISDHRNSDGVPLVIHNGGQPNREEDYLTKSKITAHYRFDATKVPQEVLRPWQD